MTDKITQAEYNRQVERVKRENAHRPQMRDAILAEFERSILPTVERSGYRADLADRLLKANEMVNYWDTQVRQRRQPNINESELAFWQGHLDLLKSAPPAYEPPPPPPDRSAEIRDLAVNYLKTGVEKSIEAAEKRAAVAVAYEHGEPIPVDVEGMTVAERDEYIRNSDRTTAFPDEAVDPRTPEQAHFDAQSDIAEGKVLDLHAAGMDERMAAKAAKRAADGAREAKNAAIRKAVGNDPAEWERLGVTPQPVEPLGHDVKADMTAQGWTEESVGKAMGMPAKDAE